VVFHNNCLVCHSLEPGQNGHGPSLAEYFKRNPSQAVDQTQQLIRNGSRRMPPFRDRLSSDQIQDVIAYIQNAMNARPYNLDHFQRLQNRRVTHRVRTQVLPGCLPIPGRPIST